jgi:hypothetical protein
MRALQEGECLRLAALNGMDASIQPVRSVHSMARSPLRQLACHVCSAPQPCATRALMMCALTGSAMPFLGGPVGWPLRAPGVSVAGFQTCGYGRSAAALQQIGTGIVDYPTVGAGITVGLAAPSLGFMLLGSG